MIVNIVELPYSKNLVINALCGSRANSELISRLGLRRLSSALIKLLIE